jgi:hypothetical protein
VKRKITIEVEDDNRLTVANTDEFKTRLDPGIIVAIHTDGQITLCLSSVFDKLLKDNAIS